MKVAIVSESSADDAALEVLLAALTEIPVEFVSRKVRPGGFDAALRVIEPVLLEGHWSGSFDAVAILLDSNGSEVHRDGAEHDEGRCRYCRTRAKVRRILDPLTPMAGREPIQVALAVPTPAIEAWYHFATNNSFTESVWIQRRAGGASSRTTIEGLKRTLYGTDRPGFELATKAAVDSATKLVDRLDDLEAFFPNSFGLFARDVRGWLG